MAIVIARAAAIQERSVHDSARTSHRAPCTVYANYRTTSELTLTLRKSFCRNEKLLQDPVRLRQISERIPAGRWGEPRDFAGPVVFLASAASQYVCGEVLVVDGVSSFLSSSCSSCLLLPCPAFLCHTRLLSARAGVHRAAPCDCR